MQADKGNWSDEMTSQTNGGHFEFKTNDTDFTGEFFT